MTRLWNSFAVSALCLLAAACSETRFLESMGMGKQAPDESVVQRNASLALPPDLQLRPPSDAPAAAAPAGPAAASPAPQALADPSVGGVAGGLDPAAEAVDAGAPAPSTVATAPDTLTTEPLAAPTAVTPAPQTVTPAPQAVTPAPQAVAPSATPAATGNPRENAFVKYGISKTHPDGKPKTEQELNRELLAAIKAERQRQDPKYGTIFNMGGLFGGD